MPDEGDKARSFWARSGWILYEQGLKLAAVAVAVAAIMMGGPTILNQVGVNVVSMVPDINVTITIPEDVIRRIVDACRV